jgi:hypothetical protein
MRAFLYCFNCRLGRKRCRDHSIVMHCRTASAKLPSLSVAASITPTSSIASSRVVLAGGANPNARFPGLFQLPTRPKAVSRPSQSDSVQDGVGHTPFPLGCCQYHAHPEHRVASSRVTGWSQPDARFPVLFQLPTRPKAVSRPSHSDALQDGVGQTPVPLCVAASITPTSSGASGRVVFPGGANSNLRNPGLLQCRAS